MVGSTIASMMAIESIRIVFSAAAIGPCGSRMFIGAPIHLHHYSLEPSAGGARPQTPVEAGSSASDTSPEFVVPPDPFAEATAHHVLQLPALQPRQFLGEEGDALPVAAGHAGDVGAPEEALRPERIVDAVQPVPDVTEGIGLRGVMRRAGRLHRDVRQLRELHQLVEMDE